MNPIKIVKGNWNDIKSIKRAEKKKAVLEHKGYTLINTAGGLNTFTLSYRMKK